MDRQALSEVLSPQRSGARNQGGGDPESAGRYNEATREFVESGKVAGKVICAGGRLAR
jgi:hypothetical protein